MGDYLQAALFVPFFLLSFVLHSGSFYVSHSFCTGYAGMTLAAMLLGCYARA